MKTRQAELQETLDQLNAELPDGQFVRVNVDYKKGTFDLEYNISDGDRVRQFLEAMAKLGFYDPDKLN